MPTYAYTCTACSHKLEQFQKITDEPLTDCPECGKKTLRRGPGGGSGLYFKGAGFYITDYAKKPAGAPEAAPAASSGCCPCGKNNGSCSN